MKQFRSQNHGRQRGGVLIGVLFFLVITSILLMGIGSLATGHEQRAQMDANYAAVLSLAEAGVNYEYRKLTNNVTQADTSAFTVSSPFGTPGTSFTVQCVNRGTATPWSGPGTNLDVLSTGQLNGVIRQIRVSCKGYTVMGKFAVFGTHSVYIQGSVSIVGDVGTDGAVTVGGASTIQGGVYLFGPGATYSGGTPAGVSSQPLVWQTVDEKALALFPNSGSTAPGGLAYLASHNDNARVGLPASGGTLSSGVTLVGPGNYYVTGIDTHGNTGITFDNRNGDINVWVGPSGGSGSVYMRGCSSMATTDPSQGGHQVNILVATTGSVDMAGTTGIDANIYAYNKDAYGNPYGTVTNHGTPDVVGSIVAYDVTLQGNPSVQYIPGVQQPQVPDYYGFDTSWQEVNPRTIW